MPQIAVRTGVTLTYQTSGEGEPLLLIMGTSGSIGLWGGLVARLAERYQVIAFDNRGLGGSERGEGAISVTSLAEDAVALLEALDVPRAHCVGWSLGSAIVQEVALAHPERVLTAVLYSTWARCDGFQRSVLAALRHPYATGDMEAALTVAGLAFSPQALDAPDFAEQIGAMLPAFPQGEAQMQVTTEQWDADLAHDTLDRLGGDAGGRRRAGPADPALAGEEGRGRHPRSRLRAAHRPRVEPLPAPGAARRPGGGRHVVPGRARAAALTPARGYGPSPTLASRPAGARRPPASVT